MVIDKSAVVPYNVTQMYTLVEDIESYPEFLPWCKEARITRRENERQLEASITLAKGGLEKSFTTTNTLSENEFIEMHLLKGPFSRLYGRWKFHSLGDNAGCKVVLHMDFEFSSRMLRLSLGPVFSHIVNSLVDAFIQRAREVYG